MKRRWVIYPAIGMAFGVFDFFYLGFLYQVPLDQLFANSPAGQTAQLIVGFVVLNLGVWLLPVVPVALHESRFSRSRSRSALAGLSVWCTGIVAYYLANAGYLLFWGLPSRPELHVSNRGSAHFWENWWGVLRGDVLGGITEWMIVAVVGGAIVGFLVSAVHLRFATPSLGEPRRP